METPIQNQPQTGGQPEAPARQPSTSAKKIWIPAILLTVILGAGIYAGYKLSNQEQAAEKMAEEIANGSKREEKQPPLDIIDATAAQAGSFAEYAEMQVKANPKVAPYHVDEKMANVMNAKDFTFSAEAQKLLVKNAFVVSPGWDNEFFQMYERNRYAFVPNFITTDSILHNYHLMFDFLLKKVEEEKLSDELRKLSAGMLADSLNQFEVLKGTSWENAARRNAGFFAVAAKLQNPSVETPAIISGEVTKELQLIEAHQGIEASPVMNIGGGDTAILETPQGPLPLDALKEDYSQYIPRGHYDKTDKLKAYFKAMMWYGRLTFRLKSEDETRSAILITKSLLDGKENRDSWNRIYEPVNFFVGKSDDITYYQLEGLVKKVYGKDTTIAAMSAEEEKFALLVKETEALEPPQINSMPIFNADIQPDREKEIKGFRFMGQRFTVDASIFQRLITREVGPKGGTCADAPFTEGRMLPKGLDIPAAMGSAEALGILDAAGETQFACYPENMEKLKTHIASLPAGNWTQNLYWGWLYQLRPLLEVKGEGYPVFMQNQAWQRKELNSYLGSWTELKHDTILYAKQVYAEMGGGGGDKTDDRGYVEPNAMVYARLASLLKMTQEGLDIRGLLSSAMKENLSKMETLAMSLKEISEKELNGEKLSDEEYELIRSYGGQLEHFWLEVNKDEPAYKETNDQNNYLMENPAAVVTDVATDPGGSVLEEGTGKINSIFVVVPVDGKLKIAKGAVYSYYEFSWPMSDRLTDKKWRDLLNSEKTPELPAWTKDFVSE